MGLLDRLLGRSRRPSAYGPQGGGYDAGPYQQQYDEPGYAGSYADGQPGRSAPRSADEQALERYRYLLRTAPPDQVEAAHEEAFGKLTPDQRRQVLEQLAAVPGGERPRGDDARSLARAATRAEVRQPGTLERAFGGGGYGYGRGPGMGMGMGGMGMGSMIGGSLLGTVAGVVVGSAVADALFDTGLGDGGLFGGGDEEAYADGYQDGAENDQGDGGGDYSADGGDFGGGDSGGGGDF
ncbi:hypothetical protein SAMN05661080_03280 [Modestobacter sp. DSM 44400]|uniref:hypothetical protein n=1 Tax=Modestobacter sp. DSM 44400 TaxID=1550230 RepID=UPI00089A918F|nr:hypothetical protein [Modestobacter sp. DSM 44400]SDY38046.1 hypothetical protein SAMN05661080_03280 [Modestobacter sp. DSM 44400]